jgi:hypothetical protein
VTSHCRAFTFIEAAHETGIKPDVMRRYLDRPEVRALLLAERRAFRAAICGGNEGALSALDRSASARVATQSQHTRKVHVEHPLCGSYPKAADT